MKIKNTPRNKKSSNNNTVGHDASLKIKGQMLDTIINFTHDAIISKSLDGIITGWNNAAERIYGYKAREAIGKHITLIYPKDRVDEFDEIIETIKKGKNIEEYETQRVRKDGRCIDVVVNVLPMRDENGKIIGASKIAIDITYLKEAKELSLQYSHAIMQSPMSVMISDIHGNLEYVNPRFTELTGYTLEEIKDKNPRFLKSGYTQPEEYKKLWNTIKSGDTWHGEFHNKKKDGELYWESVAISPVKDANGKIKNFLAVKEDITERKNAENALEESEKRYKGLVESQRDLIVRVDPSGRFTFVNKVYCETFGKKESELIGKSFMPLVHPDDIEATLSAMENLKKPPYRIYVEQRAKTVKGWRWLAWEDYAIKDEKGETIEIQAIGRDITKGKQIEQALRESQAILDAFFNNTPAALLIYDDKNHYIRLNKFAAAIYGSVVKNLVGKSIFEVLPEDLAKATAKLNKHVLVTKKPNFTDIIKTKLPLNSSKAKNTYWQGVRFPIPLLGGEKGIGVVYIDVTEQIQAQEKVRESEEKYNKTFASNPAAVALTRLEDGLFSEVNETWCKLLGYKREEAIGHPARKMHIWPTADSAQKFVKELKSKGNISGWEQEFCKKSGEKFVTQLSAQIIPIQGETLVLSSLIDITERKRAEEALRAEKEQFQKLIDNIPVMITVYDPKLNINYFNKYLEKKIGWKTEDEKKVDIMKKIYPDENIRNNAQEFMNSLKKGWNDIPMMTKEGKIIESSWSNIKLSNNLQVGIGIDISERKELERRKDEFLSIASHELKTPLTSQKAFMQILQKLVNDQHDKKLIHLLERALTQTDKLTSLVNDLLDVSRIQSGKMQFRETIFDFDSLVNEAIKDMQLSSSTHIIQIIGKTEQKVFADRDRTAQVIFNLLSNAVKYSKHGNKIIVSTSNSSNKVLVKVQDFGIGMSKNMQEKIFEKFYRADTDKNSTTPGLGLGLYISSQIIERSGGKLWVESEEGKGSTFYFTLPIHTTAKNISKTFASK